MSSKSKSVNLSFEINNKNLKPPREWFDVGILATFEEQTQANITTEQFTFILDAYNEIKSHIQGGATGSTVGIFEGIPIKIKGVNQDNELLVFDGFIDLYDSQINDTIGEVSANIKKLNGLNSFNDRLEALDYGFLKEKGVFSNSDYTDLQYVVIKIDASFESLVSAIMLYLLIKQAVEVVKEIADDILTATTITGTAGLGSAVAGPAYAVGKAIINAIYFAALLAAIVDLGRDLITTFVPPTRKHKCIQFRKLIEKVCTHLGYSFETDVTELDSYYYLPSNIRYDEFDERGFLKKVGTIGEGIPNATDYGYTCLEMFQLARNMFNGRFAIVDNTIHFHSENSNYWIKKATYTLPDVLESNYRYNTDELPASLLISFTTDLNDEYTIENYRGTSYQVLTDAKNINDDKKKTIIGLNDTRFPVALGNRKGSLTGFEKFLAVIAGIFDGAINTLGGNSNFKSQIKNRIGSLKVSTNYHSIPKIIPLEAGKIPSNHREKISAKYLYNNYHNEKSFIANNYKRQRKVFEGVTIPFGFEDFLNVINNSYFSTIEGKTGKFTSLEWNMMSDKATVNYWIEEIYTKNLKETFIEP